MNAMQMKGGGRTKAAVAFVAGALAFAAHAADGFASNADWSKLEDGSWRSGAITDDQTSVLVNEGLATKPGVVSFEWKTSSEEGYDELLFFIDGERRDSISGEMDDWQQVRFPIAGDGSHTLAWKYSKDGSVSSGEDCGWIRNISFKEADYTLTLDAQGGKLKNASHPASEGIAVGELPHPAYPGHAFLGWWTALADGEKVMPETVFTNSATLYARWKESKYDFEGPEWTEQEDGTWKSGKSEAGESSSLITHVNGEGVLRLKVLMEALSNGYDGGEVLVHLDGAEKLFIYQLGDDWQDVNVAIAGAGLHTVKIERDAFSGPAYIDGLKFDEADSWVDAFASDAVELPSEMDGTAAVVDPSVVNYYREGNWIFGSYGRLYKWTAPKSGYVAFDGEYGYENVGGTFQWPEGSYGYRKRDKSGYLERLWFTAVEEGKTYYIVPDLFGKPLTWFEAPEYSASVDENGKLSFVGVPPADLTLPDETEVIDFYQFENCMSLNSVVIPAGVRYLGEDAFQWCENLTNVVFKGNAPCYFYDNVFYMCPSNLTIRVPSFSTGWNAESIPGILKNGSDEYRIEYIPDFTLTRTAELDGIGLVTETNKVPENFAIKEAFALPELEKAGQVFLGWFTAAEGGEKVDGDYVVTADMALYAQWAPAVTAVIDAGAEDASIGDAMTNMVFASGEKVQAKLAALSGARAGYVLTGWSVAKEGGNVPVDENTVAEDGMKFVAEWTPAVVVTFKTNETDGEAYATVTLAQSGTVGVGMPDDPENDMVEADGTRYLFANWYTLSTVTNVEEVVSEDGATTNSVETIVVTTNAFDAATVVADSVTVFAGWTPAWEVTFYAGNGGEFDDDWGNVKYVTVAKGGVLGNLPEFHYTYSDYTFAGWWYNVEEEQYVDNEDGSITTNLVTVAKAADENMAIDKPMEIYANWNAKVRFYANGGTVDASGYTFELNADSWELPVAVREGYQFAGWYVWEKYWDDDLDELIEHYVGPLTPEEAVNKWDFEAKWNVVTTFDCGNGTVVTNTVREYNEVEFPTDPVREGYIFAGWADESGTIFDEDGYNYDEYDNVLVRRDLASETLTAKWYVPVEFNTGADTISAQILEGEAFGENMPENPVDDAVAADGSTRLFDHWYTLTTVTNSEEVVSDDGATTNTVENVVVTTNAFDATTVVSAATTVYAEWADAWNVAFDAKGGMCEEASRQVVKGAAIGTLPDATRDALVFNGWWRDVQEEQYESNEDGSVTTNLVTKAEAIAAETVVESAIDAYAKWNAVVTFVADGVTNTQTVAEGEAVALPEVPVREGYAFAGWFDSDGVQVTSSNVTASAAVALAAKWTATVTFDAGEGSWTVGEGETATQTNLTEIVVLENEVIAGLMPDEPVREGYSFGGWVDANGEPVTAETEVGASATVTAKWYNFVVSFDAKGGECAEASRQVVKGAAIGTLPEATRDGLVFNGWWHDVQEEQYESHEDGSVTTNLVTKAEAVTAETVVGDDMLTLYAKWNVTVTVVANGEATTQTVEEGADVALPEAPARDGYTFVGWFKADGTQATTNMTAGSAIELTAKYSMPVTFDAGEGAWTVGEGESAFKTNLIEIAAVDGEALGALVPEVPVRDGRKFYGWFTQAEDGSESEVTAETTFTASAAVYAKWGFTVTFDAGSGFWTKYDEDGFATSFSVQTVDVVENTATGAAMPSDPDTFENFAFAGWAMTNDVAFTADTIVTEDITVMATWNAAFIVEFDANGGEVAEEYRKVLSGAAVGELPTATLDGWGMTGWFTAMNGGDKVDADFTVTGNTMLYAHWAKQLTLTFDANGGTVDETARTVLKNSTLEALPTPVRNGMKFLGWFTAADGGEQVEAGGTVTESGSKTLYAHWTAGWKVTFNANGGTVDETIRMVAKGDALGTLPVAVRKGYTLVGWYTAKSKGKAVKASTKPAKDVTYYAIWKIGSYKVTAYVDGSGKVTGAKAYAYGKKVTLKAAPKKGYVFAGWEYVVDGDADDFWPAYETQKRQVKVSFSMPAANVSVQAVFVKKASDKAPTVTFDYAGPWHLDVDSALVVTATVDSVSYAAATATFPAGLKKGMKLAKVAGTDDKWVLKVTNLAKCSPGAFTVKVTAKNRAGKKATASIRVFGPNTTTAVANGALILGEGMSQATEEAFELYVGMKFDWADLGIAPAAGWTLSSVSGLPTGLKWNAKTKKVTGVCSKAGTFTTTFSVSKKKVTYKATVTFKVNALPAALVGTFNGCTATPDGEEAVFGADSRLVKVTAAASGKLSAKIGSYSFAGTGWSIDAATNYVATLTGKHTTGKGKSKVTYVDTLTITVNPVAEWTDMQLTGTVTTVLSGTDAVLNADTLVFAQRNAFADEEDAALVGDALASLGSCSLSVVEATDSASYAYDLVTLGTVAAKVSVKADGTATFFGVIGGKSVSGSSVVEVDGAGVAVARFFTSAYVIAITFEPGEDGAYAIMSGRTWVK